MSNDHVSGPQAERFLRARLSREENQRIVRHLLAECKRCTEVATAASGRGGVASALGRFGGRRDGEAGLADPARYSRAFARILGPEAEAESRESPAEAALLLPVAMPAG